MRRWLYRILPMSSVEPKELFLSINYSYNQRTYLLGVPGDTITLYTNQGLLFLDFKNHNASSGHSGIYSFSSTSISAFETKPDSFSVSVIVKILAHWGTIKNATFIVGK